jgi:hypothetical protein
VYIVCAAVPPGEGTVSASYCRTLNLKMAGLRETRSNVLSMECGSFSALEGFRSSGNLSPIGRRVRGTFTITQTGVDML